MDKKNFGGSEEEPQKQERPIEKAKGEFEFNRKTEQPIGYLVEINETVKRITERSAVEALKKKRRGY